MSSNGTGPMRIERNREPADATASAPEMPPLRLLRFPEVRRRTGLSRSTVWRLERKGEFPAHCRISAGAVGWVEGELQEWLHKKLTSRSR